MDATHAIDLTESPTRVAVQVSPERPVKRPRASRRLAALRDQEEQEKDERGARGGEEEAAPQYRAEGEGRPPVHGYFEVDEILDRRTRKYGSESAGLRQVVEYQVSWKKPPSNYTGDESDYEPSWLIAENLDQNSLASAFRQFPMEADPDRRIPPGGTKVKAKAMEDHARSWNDFSDDESEEDSEEEDEEMMENSSDDMQDCEEEESNKFGDVKDPGVSDLEESDYDSPGTVELVVHRQTYRVGQSFYGGPDENTIFTIVMLQPLSRKAVCRKFVHVEKCFVRPRGHEGSYVLARGEVALELSCLKLPCTRAFDKFPMTYLQEDEKQRSFAYYNETGKIIHHPTGRPAVLDLFAGAGGMSLGMEKYFDVKWVVDNNHLASATFRANKPNSDMKIYTEDAKTFLKRSVQGHPCYPAAGEVDHIHGSPPCKGYSRANRNGGKDDAKNNKQTLLFVKAIRHFRPKTATFENVPGLVLDEYKEYLQSVVANLLAMAYQVRVQILTASSYGDPQKRRRLIVIAARCDCLLPAMPSPTHGTGLLPVKTCKDALCVLDGHAPTSSRSVGAILVAGRVVFNHVVPGHRLDREADFELIEDEPSRTVLAKARPHLHYDGHRFISVREAACLQSFPLSYQFFGGLSHQYSQVGNAVPVKMATAIARSVAVVHGCAV